MKCISIKQPWASLIAVGAKTSETRSWRPPLNVIGERIGIHSTKVPVTKVSPVVERQVMEALHRADAGPPYMIGQAKQVNRFKDLPCGQIICTAILDSVFRVESIRMSNGFRYAVGTLTGGGQAKHIIDDFGDWSIGRCIWNLTHIKVIEPIEYSGVQRLWECRELDGQTERIGRA